MKKDFTLLHKEIIIQLLMVKFDLMILNGKLLGRYIEMKLENLTKKIQEGIEECDIYESLTDLYFGILNFEVGKKHIPSSYNDFKDVDFDEAYKNIFKLYESLVRTIERIELCLHDVHMAAESQQDLQFLLSYYNER